uniref:Protein FAM33A n=1 Tax=Ananas comosus var. bracteatus TaxID=296719 RepID=A0A6V7PAH1_ANACO|nr:unnamed protein product [Ananas comosus var. bracteatus]
MGAKLFSLESSISYPRPWSFSDLLIHSGPIWLLCFNFQRVSGLLRSIRPEVELAGNSNYKSKQEPELARQRLWRDRDGGAVAAQQQQQQQQHPAVNDVTAVLSKASRDLGVVRRHLELEFRRSYPEHVNPCEVVARIKTIQEELVLLKELCRELLAEKQDLIDKARTSLVSQRSSLQRLLASSGLPLMSESDETAYANLNQLKGVSSLPYSEKLDWASHVRSGVRLFGPSHN